MNYADMNPTLRGVKEKSWTNLRRRKPRKSFSQKTYGMMMKKEAHRASFGLQLEEREHGKKITEISTSYILFIDV